MAVRSHRKFRTIDGHDMMVKVEGEVINVTVNPRLEDSDGFRVAEEIAEIIGEMDYDDIEEDYDPSTGTLDFFSIAEPEQPDTELRNIVQRGVGHFLKHQDRGFED